MILHKALQPKRAELVRAMLSGGGDPVRLAIRRNALAGGVVIEGPDFLPIGGAFASYEEAHEAHRRAWAAAWKRVE